MSLLFLLSLVATLLLVLYLLLRFNSVWVYRFFDRALGNDRAFLSEKYELARYIRLDQDGQIDTAVRWPGWDGWYFFVIPNDRSLPVKMVRASLMTGLYGLNGIDNYALLPSNVSPFTAVEYLVLIPIEEASVEETGSPSGAARVKRNFLGHSYLPKPDLEINPRELDVALRGFEQQKAASSILYGRVRGKWPKYRLHFLHSETGLEVELDYHGQKLVWWADVPGIFTYFSAFGEFGGRLSLQRRENGALGAAGREHTVLYSIQGSGGFEHGFARKPFNFDLLYRPIRLIQRVVPTFRPICYHYEGLIGEDGVRGGWMRARGFGIDFRNRGGLHLEETYQPIRSIKVVYLEAEANCAVTPASPQPPVLFYKRWKVKAVTEDGELEYVASRDWPPAPIASNMIYYNHSFEGTYRGRQIQGRGYGEYLHI